jgi:hypothetical protein
VRLLSGEMYRTAGAAFTRSSQAQTFAGEVLTYRILIACALLGLYANATVRQLVDLLR